MSSNKFFTKSNGFWCQKIFLHICSFILFSLFSLSFINSSVNCNGDILRLFSAGLGAGLVAGSSAGSGLVFFTENISNLKLLWFFSIVLRNKPMLFRKGLISTGFIPLFKPFNILTNLLYCWSVSFNDKCPSHTS